MVRLNNDAFHLLGLLDKPRGTSARTLWEHAARPYEKSGKYEISLSRHFKYLQRLLGEFHVRPDGKFGKCKRKRI